MQNGVTPDRRHLRAIRPNPVHAAGLAGLFLFNEGGGARVHDLAGRIGDGVLGSANRWTQGPHGGAVQHDRTLASILHFPGSVKAGPFTALWRGVFRSGPGSHYWAGEWAHGYVGGQNAAWGFNVGTGGVVAFRAASRQLVSTTSIPIGKPLTLIGSYDGTRVDLYVHAGGAVEHLGGSATGFVTDSRYSLRLGGYWGGNSASGTGDVETDLFVLWRRKIGPQEAMALVRAPERIIGEPARRVYVLAHEGPQPAFVIEPYTGWQAHAAGAAPVVQEHGLIAAGGGHGHHAAKAAAGQGHELGPVASLHQQGASDASVTLGAVLPPHHMAHGQAADSPQIMQIHGINALGVRHLHGAGAPAVLDGAVPLPGERVTVEREGRVRRPGPDPRIF